MMTRWHSGTLSNPHANWSESVSVTWMGYKKFGSVPRLNSVKYFIFSSDSFPNLCTFFILCMVWGTQHVLVTITTQLQPSQLMVTAKSLTNMTQLLCSHWLEIQTRTTVYSSAKFCYIITFWVIVFLQALEDYLWQSSDLLDRLEDMREDLNHNDFADDVTGAKKGLDIHNEVKKKIHKIPVESIDTMGQRLLQR